MNERDDEAPFPREPWQRLLEDSSGGPPETTDARIRAAARRDLAPRGHRWWLPASLAASLVLAVVLVRSEMGSGGRIHFLPSEDRGEAAMQGRIVDRQEGEQAREPGRSPASPSLQKDKRQDEAEPDAYGYADSGLGQEEAGAAARVGGPERELRAASEAPEERIQMDLPLPPRQAVPSMTEPAAAPRAPMPAAAPAAKEKENLGEITVTGANPRGQDAAPPSAWTPTHVAAPVDNTPARSAGLVADRRTPEAWYAAIEKLRAQGRTQEADRELERLKKAWPGWLEKHLAEQKKP
jgi:hypothetical protein